MEKASPSTHILGWFTPLNTDSSCVSQPVNLLQKITY